MPLSTSRAKKGVAAMVSGTIAAPRSDDVPTTSRVNGMIATTRMMNGVERVDVDDDAEHAVETLGAREKLRRGRRPLVDQEDADRQTEMIVARTGSDRHHEQAFARGLDEQVR